MMMPKSKNGCLVPDFSLTLRAASLHSSQSHVVKSRVEGGHQLEGANYEDRVYKKKRLASQCSGKGLCGSVRFDSK